MRDRSRAAADDVTTLVAARSTREEMSRRVPMLLAPALAVLGGGIVPVVVIAAQPNTAGRLVWIPAVVVMAWSALRLAGIVADDRPPLFQFTFFTYVYAYLGLAPLVQLRAGEFPLTSPLVEPENVVTIWSLIGTGIVAYEVGVAAVRGRVRRAAAAFDAAQEADAQTAEARTAEARTAEPGTVDAATDAAGTAAAAQAAPVTATADDRPELRISEQRTLVLVVVGIALSVAFVAAVGIGPLLSSRQDVQLALDDRFADTSFAALVLAIGSGPLLVGVHALYRVRRRNIREGVARRMTPLLVVAAAVLFVAVNPISASRYSAGTVALSFVVLFGGLATAWRRRIVLLGVVVSFVLLLPSLALSRYSADNQYTGPTASGLLGNIRFSGDWDSFAAIGNAVHYVQGHGVAHGFQFLGSLTFWMPRSLWPGKPLDTGILLANDRGYDMTNLSAPLWAEAYVNGGLVIVAVLFLAYGALSVVASSLTWRALRSDGPWAIAGSIFAWYSFILLRGSLLQATGGAVLMLVCTLFVAQRRRPAADQEGPTR